MFEISIIQVFKISKFMFFSNVHVIIKKIKISICCFSYFQHFKFPKNRCSAFLIFKISLYPPPNSRTTAPAAAMLQHAHYNRSDTIGKYRSCVGSSPRVVFLVYEHYKDSKNKRHKSETKPNCQKKTTTTQNEETQQNKKKHKRGNEGCRGETPERGYKRDT